MSERKPGWYWCVMDGALFPIYYSGGMWWKGGYKLWEEPRIVSGRIPTPDEPWQCVPVEPEPLMASVAEDHIEAGHDADTIWRAMLMCAPRKEDV